MIILADTEARRVVQVIVVDGHRINKIRILGHLNDHIEIGARLFVVVPQDERVNVILFLKIHRDVLQKRAEFDVASISRFLIAVGHHGELTDDWLLFRPGRRLSLGDVGHSSRRIEGRARFPARRFKLLNALQILRCPDKHRFRQLQRQRFQAGRRLVVGDAEVDTRPDCY